jgi:hypothetical protein
VSAHCCSLRPCVCLCSTANHGASPIPLLQRDARVCASDLPLWVFCTILLFWPMVGVLVGACTKTKRFILTKLSSSRDRFHGRSSDAPARCRTHPAAAGCTAGSGQEAAQTCSTEDFFRRNLEAASIRPNATYCILVVARRGPSFCSIRTD